MSEDWASIAAEVSEAIKSVASTDAGYPATIRRVSTAGGSAYDPASGTRTVAYSTIRVVETVNRVRDRDGTLTGAIRRSLLVGAGAGVVPNKADKVLVGQSLSYVDVATDAALDWEEIDEVLRLSPAGVDVMYEILLAG